MLFSVGEALEGFAAERARGALEALLDLAPPVAFKLDSRGQRIEVPVGDLAPGDHIMVRPGDRVGADGIVSSGHSAVDQAAITGESIPADKAPGDAVYAGTINTFGALEIEVTRRAADNTLSQMVALVREASHARHPSSVSSIALPESTRPLWPLWLSFWPRFPLFCLPSRSWEIGGWLMRALQMLVITCPCALVISTPVTVVSALTHAAGRGVLVKGGAHSLSGVLTLWRLTRRVPLPQGIPRSRTS